MKKKAFISVWNKDKAVEFAQALTEKYGYKIVAESSTYELLKENGINAEKATDKNEISKDINSYNIVAVNMYPVEEAIEKHEDEADLIQNIDTEGYSILRTAARNNKETCAISSPAQYKEVLADMEEHDGNTSLKLRRKFALKVFEKTVDYDSKVLNELSNRYEDDVDNYFSMNIKKTKNLRYGENPHQNADLYVTKTTVDYEVLSTKELSYNDILDMTTCTNILGEFYDVCCAAIVKNNAPCGVALGKDTEEAFAKAIDCDPLSALGAAAGFTQVVNENIAKMLGSIMPKIVTAPDYTPKALHLLQQNKDLIIIKLNVPLIDYKNYISHETVITPFGTMVQTADKGELNKDNFKVVTKTKPTGEMVEDMIFAWKIAKHSKSAAVVVAKDFKAIGIGQGQASRTDAFELALNKACDGSKDAVAASDGVCSSVDNIYVAAHGRIAAIIQPGGSPKDEEIIKVADKYNIAMITTGLRHLKY